MKSQVIKMRLPSIKSIEDNGIRFHFLPSKKYKTITIIAKFKTDLNRDTITKRALIPYLLKQGTVSFPSEQALQEKLDQLYGASLRTHNAKKGKNHILHLELELANEKFIPNAPSFIDEALILFHELIYDPILKEAAFDQAGFAREKKRLESNIKAIYDHKIAYANQRLIDHMYDGEVYALHHQGYLEDLPGIDGKQLVNYYQQMIEEDQLDIYVLGDFDVEDMERNLTGLFAKEKRKPKLKMDKVQRKLREEKKPHTVVEVDTIQQAKLHLGYRTHIHFADQDYPSLLLFNALFGGFSNSLLFTTVREAHSLAYYIASYIESQIGLLIVYSGVASTEYERTIELIEIQLEKLRQGDFSAQALDHAKQLVINDIKESLDHPNGTVELHYQQVLANYEARIEDIIGAILQVTKEMVVKVAETIQLDTVYVLASEVGEEDEAN